MNKEKVFFLLQAKAVLDTVKAVPSGVPESQVYLAFNMDLQQSNALLTFLEDKRAVKVKNNLITAGKEFDGLYEILEKLETKLKEMTGAAQ